MDNTRRNEISLIHRNCYSDTGSLSNIVNTIEIEVFKHEPVTAVVVLTDVIAICQHWINLLDNQLENEHE